MDKSINFSLKRFALLFALIVVVGTIIGISEYLELPINWKLIANTIFIAGIVSLVIVRIILKRKSPRT